MAKAMSIKVGNPLRKLVLLKLADNANDQGECWPSLQYIADQCEISKRSVISHISALCDSGLLKKEHREGKFKANASNLYTLSLNSETPALGGANNSLGSETPASPPSETPAPRTSHSFEPVIEPINGTSAHADEPDADGSEKQQSKKQLNSTTEKQKSNYQSVIDVFHQTLPDMPAVREITEQRKTKIRNFFSKYKFNLADWKGYLEYIGQNCRWMFESRPRHRGANDESRWRPKTFDFLLTERCYLGVVEGTYDDVR